jgi:hypothetical protein
VPRQDKSLESTLKLKKVSSDELWNDGGYIENFDEVQLPMSLEYHVEN